MKKDKASRYALVNRDRAIGELTGRLEASPEDQYQAAAMLGLSPQWEVFERLRRHRLNLQALVSTGQLMPYRIGGNPYFARAEINRLIETVRQEARRDWLTAAHQRRAQERGKEQKTAS